MTAVPSSPGLPVPRKPLHLLHLTFTQHTYTTPPPTSPYKRKNLHVQQISPSRQWASIIQNVRASRPKPWSRHRAVTLPGRSSTHSPTGPPGPRDGPSVPGTRTRCGHQRPIPEEGTGHRHPFPRGMVNACTNNSRPRTTPTRRRDQSRSSLNTSSTRVTPTVTSPLSVYPHLWSRQRIQSAMNDAGTDSSASDEAADPSCRLAEKRPAPP